MAGFNPDKYRSTFDKRHGAGAREKGLSSAREIGRMKVEADFAKDAWKERQREAKKLADKQKKEREKAEKEAQEEAEKLDKKSKEKNLFERLFDGNDRKDNKKATFLPEKKKKNTNIFEDMLELGKGAIKSANPFDDVSFGEAMMKNANSFNKNRSKQFDSVDRHSGRMVDSASLGIMGNIDKKQQGGETPRYLTQRKMGEGGGADMISSLLGYAVSGGGIAKGIQGTALGSKGLKELTKGTLTREKAKQIAKTTAKEGSAIGGIMSGTEIAGREALNPDDYNWKQNLAQFGLETGLGAVADPLLHLAKPAMRTASEGVAKQALRGHQNDFTSLAQQMGNVKETMPNPSIEDLFPNNGSPFSRENRGFPNINRDPRDIGRVNREVSQAELDGQAMLNRNRAGERAPAEIGMDGFTGRKSFEEALGLPSPKTIRRPKSPLGRDVDVAEGLGLPAPKTRPAPDAPLQVKMKYWKDQNNPIGDEDVMDMYKHMQDAESRLAQLKDPSSPEYKKIIGDYAETDPVFKLKAIEHNERKAELQNIMNKQQEWDTVKMSQDEFKAKNRPEEMKFIVPKDERMDYEAVPKRFRGTKNSASMDIHEASTRAGYDSVDDYVAYLQGIDTLLSKTRKSMNMPTGAYITSAIKNEKALSAELKEVTDKLIRDPESEALIEELSGLMTPREGYVAPEGNPLAFKSQMEMLPENLAYNANMHPNERMATKVERTQPEFPYEAKRQKVMFTDVEKQAFTQRIKQATSSSEDEVSATINTAVPEDKITPSQIIDALEQDPRDIVSFFQKSDRNGEGFSETIVDALTQNKFKRWVNKSVESVARQSQPLNIYESYITPRYLTHAQGRMAQATDPLDRMYWENQIARTQESMQALKKDGGRLIMDHENEKATGETVKRIIGKATAQFDELARVSKTPILEFFEVQTAKRIKWAHENNPNFTASKEQLALADKLLANPSPIHEKAQTVFRKLQMEYLDVLENTEYIDASKRALLEEDIYYIPFSRDKTSARRVKDNVVKPTNPKSKKTKNFMPTGTSRDVTFEGLKDFEGGSDKNYFKDPIKAWTETLVSDIGSAMRNRTHMRLVELAEMEAELGTGMFSRKLTREEYERGLVQSTKEDPFIYITAMRNGQKEYVQVQENMLDVLHRNDAFESANLLTKMTGLISTAKVTSPSYLMTAIPRDFRQAFQNSESKFGVKFIASLIEVASKQALRDELKDTGLTFSRGYNPHSAGSGGLNESVLQREIDAKLIVDGGKDFKGALQRLNERHNYIYRGLKAMGTISDDLPRMAEANLVKKRWEKGKLKQAQDRVAQLEAKMQGVDMDNFEGNPEDIMALNLAKEGLKRAKSDMQTEMLHRGRDVMNYTQQGNADLAKGIKKYVMFANTATVSKHKTLRAFKRDPIGFAVKYTAISAPLMAWAYNSYDHLSEEDQLHYDAIPDYIKQQKYLIPMGDKVYLSFPKVHELAIMENYMEAMLGTQTFESANRLAIKETMPFQSGNLLQGLVPNAEGVISGKNTVLPSTGLSPFIDTMLNKKTTFNQKDISYDPDNSDTYTSDVSKTLFGGIDALPNLPDTADYLTKQIGGDYGRTGLAMADLALDSNSMNKQDALAKVLNPAQDFRYDPDNVWWREMFLDSAKKKAQDK